MSDLPEILTRREAKARGLTKYYSGIPCVHGHLDYRGTVNGTCIPCNKIRVSKIGKRDRAKNRQKNTVRNRERLKKLRSDSPREYEEILDRARRWRLKNQDHLREYDRNTRLMKPEIKIISEAKRRAQKTSAGGYYTAEQIHDMLNKQKAKCMNCLASLRSGYEIDHITPISKGGTSWINNIQLLCPSCNHKKHSKDPIVWARRQGRLL